MDAAAAGRRVADGRPLVHTLPETARLLGKSWRTVKAMVERGDLPAVALNGRLVVPAHVLDALVGAPARVPPTGAAAGAAPGHVSRVLRELGEGLTRLADALAEEERAGPCGG
jgi:hypothetical protein